MYNMFLENCKAHLCDVLQTFLDPMNYPIHVFCSLGKDRTGLVTGKKKKKEEGRKQEARSKKK